VYRTATYWTLKPQVVDQPADVVAGAAAGPDAHLQRVKSQVGTQRAGRCKPTTRRENMSMTKAA
jgi:hypothetical protein